MAHSLKDKRSVISGLIRRLRQRFNVSVSEVAHNDAWQQAEIAVACVSNSGRVVESTLQKIVECFDAVPELAVVRVDREID
ncbi:MAG: DUF503 domain-containing protein [Armatimonadetes bacterium]|nr:DUF503 domain-containing protein [Armatimonadota bacterium]MDE2206577.1 DUF503 domain-containing protein [Armatimonadota bacterium]